MKILKTLFSPLYEAVDSFFFDAGGATRTASHVRDATDLKRMMILVLISTIPAVIMALYNTGLQANLELARQGMSAVEGWRGSVMSLFGADCNPDSPASNMMHGSLYFLPVYIVTVAVGLSWETLFAAVRKKPIHEGFLVTSILFALILPPQIPLWQAAIGISFGVVIGKEVFGGVGRNILNPALTGRAFLFFAYPAQITGDSVWVAVDAVSTATPLSVLATPGLSMTTTWLDAFLGLIPGSMGETSTLACMIGAAILIVTGVGSWRIMLGVVMGMAGLSLLFNMIGSDTNPMFQVSPLWHLVIGGFAFGTVYMATDPVSGALTNQGKTLYGLLIGMLAVMIRVINPAFPEGMMLAILFGNVFAPIIDRVFLNVHIRRRQLRNAG